MKSIVRFSCTPLMVVLLFIIGIAASRLAQQIDFKAYPAPRYAIILTEKLRAFYVTSKKIQQDVDQ